MELKINGTTLKLTKTQVKSLKKSCEKELDESSILSELIGSFKLSAKDDHKNTSYPLLITSMVKMENGECGWDLNPSDTRSFICKLKGFARKVWPSESFDNC